MLADGQIPGMKDHCQCTTTIPKMTLKKKIPEIILPDTFSQYNVLKSSNTSITVTF